MSFITLFTDEHGFVATNQRVFSAQELEPLSTVVDQAQLLSERLATQSEKEQAALLNATEQGRKEGLIAAHREASLELAEALRTLHEEHRKALHALNANCAALAVDIVRKIAGQVGSDEWLMAQALNAAEDLIDYPRVNLRVHASRVESVRRRLNEHPQARMDRVIGDDLLPYEACVLETDQGQVNVDLETQLESILELFSNQSPSAIGPGSGGLND